MYNVPILDSFRTLNRKFFKKSSNMKLSVNLACAIVLCLCLLPVIGVAADSLNCSSVKQLFETRGLNITDVPKQPLSGKFLFKYLI